MSVKIYDGLVINRDLTLADLRTIAMKARPKLDVLVEKYQLDYATRLAVNCHDNALLSRFGENADEDGKNDLKISPLSYAMRSIQYMRDENKKGLNVGLPMDFEACFFAMGSGKTLALSYGSKGLKAVFDKMIGAKEYGYWDNTDRPDGMGALEWRQRKRDWQKALGKDFYMSPAEAGVSVKLVSNKYASWWTPEISEVIAQLGGAEFSTQARAARLAEAICRDIHASQSDAYKDMREKKGDPADLSGVMGALLSWREVSQGSAKPMVDMASRLLASALPAIDQQALSKSRQDIGQEGAALKIMIAERVAFDSVEPAKKSAIKARL